MNGLACYILPTLARSLDLTPYFLVLPQLGLMACQARVPTPSFGSVIEHTSSTSLSNLPILCWVRVSWIPAHLSIFFVIYQQTFFHLVFGILPASILWTCPSYLKLECCSSFMSVVTSSSLLSCLLLTLSLLFFPIIAQITFISAPSNHLTPDSQLPDSTSLYNSSCVWPHSQVNFTSILCKYRLNNYFKNFKHIGTLSFAKLTL